MPVPEPAPRVYQFGPYSLEPTRRLLLREGQVVPLHPKALDTLLVLVENAGKPVEKDALMRAVWPDTFVEESNLAHNISVLRKVLGEGPGGRAWIETLPKRGYQFVGPLSATWQESPGVLTRPASVPLPRLHRRRLATVAALVLVVGLPAGMVWYLASRRAADRPSVDATFTQLTNQPGQELYPSLSPDGRFLAYASVASGKWDIFLQRAGGKNPVNLTKDSPFDDTQPAFSPDGQQIAYRSERDGGGIFLMGALGEWVRRLTDFGYHPAWSPDGKQIVCSTGSLGDQPPGFHSAAHGRLFIVEVASGAKRLIDGPVGVLQPQWSPHGYRIAYWGGPTGRRVRIWTSPATGGHAVPVTDGTRLDWNPVWSADGSYLYFCSDLGGSMNIRRVRIAEKSGEVQGRSEPVTTASPYAGYLSAAWGGRHLAFAQVTRTINLQRMDFDPWRERVLKQPIPVTRRTWETTWPDLSPDGKWLAFSAVQGKQEDLFVVRTDGTALLQLTDDIHLDRAPRWSPDGKRLAFYSDRGGKHQIWSIRPDGTGINQITSAPGHVVFPIWSPVDSRLAYSVDGGSSFLMDLRRPWQEQTLEALPQLSEPNTSFRAYTWSSDGRMLAGYQVKGEGVFTGITVYSFDSKKFERLTEFGSYPRWLSDNRRLLFRYRDKLYLVDSRTKKAREIFSVAPNLAASGLALARDDRVIYFPLWVTEADVWLMTMQR